MIRTQIQLTEEQARRLHEAAAAEGRSMADLIREAVDAHLRKARWVSREELIRRSLESAGRFHSGCPDVAVEHDRYLDEAYGDG